MVKRLLCIVGSMNAGGAETFLMKVYRELDKTKYQMDFAVAEKQEGFYDKEIIALGGKIYHITPKSKGAFKNFNDIRRIVKKEKYNYVLRTSQHSLSALELLAARTGGARVRIFRSSNSNTTTGSNKQMVLHRICLFMPKFFANVRIAPSTEAAEYMFGKNCVKNGVAKLVPNGVDMDVYQFSLDNRVKYREEFQVLDNQLLVGHVGRFNQQKNHRYLIKIFSELVKKEPSARLVLVGAGELKEEIECLVRSYNLDKNVIFAGLRKDVSGLLSAFDVFLFPSFYEGMPNTVIEAQATGLPCLISDTITKECNLCNSVIFKSLEDSAEDWAASIIQLAYNKKKTDVVGSFKEKGFDIESSAAIFRDVVFEKGF